MCQIIARILETNGSHSLQTFAKAESAKNIMAVFHVRKKTEWGRMFNTAGSFSAGGFVKTTNRRTS